MSLASALKDQFEACVFTVHKNAEGMTHEESLRRDADGGNCANWVLGHMVATRNLVHGMLGLEPVLSADELEPYDRGSSPERAVDGQEWGALIERLDASQGEVAGALEAAGDEGLSAPVPERFASPFLTGTVGDAIAKLAFHEAYHAGQIGILRRAAGHGGALA